MKFGTTAIILIGAGLVTACAKPVVINPSWLHQPGPEALGEAYPVFAAMAGFSGQVTLQCVVEPDGHLSLCQAKKVLPEGLGFDRAALSLAAQYLATPQIIDGEARKASVAFVHRFHMGEDEPAAPWTGPELSAEHLAAGRRLAEVLTAFLEHEQGLDSVNLGVDPDREQKVRAIVVQVMNEFREENLQQFSLALARTFTIPELERMLAREPGLEHLFARLENAPVDDVALALHHRQEARLQALYCASYDCRTPPSSPRE